MKGETPSKEEVVAEFSARKKAVDASVDKEKEAKKSDQATRSANRVMRNSGAGKEEAKAIEESKQ